mgnify:CR=1 FL=1
MINYIPKQGKELSKEEIKKLIDENHVKFIRLQFVDINGMVKNMAVPAKQIDKILNNELMLDGSSIKGFRSIETSDMYFYPDCSTFAILPWREKEGKWNVARIICDIHNADGTPFEGCPRCNLKRVIKEAEEMGMVNKVVPFEQLEDETVDWCKTIMKRSPMAIRMIKRALNAELDGQHGLMEFAGDATLMYYLMAEAQEGKNAFLEKRDPDFDQFPKFP